MIDDNYRLLFGTHAAAVRQAYPERPPLLDRESRHRMLAVLDASGTHRVEAPHAPEAFAAVYGAEYGQVSPVYRRLAGRCLPRGGYVRLTRRLLGEPKTARALTHFDLLGPRRLAMVEALPPELVRPGFVALVPNLREARELAQVFGVLTCQGRARAELAQTLLRAKTRAEVRSRLRKALTPRKLRQAPWEGDDTLRPVCDVADVKRLGQEFENCMRQFAEQWSLEGDVVIYRYEGRTPAVCAVQPDPPFGWRIDEIKGMKNTRVSRSVRADIAARFAGAGIRDGHPLRYIIGSWV